MTNNIRDAFASVMADEKMKSDVKTFLNEKSTTRERRTFFNKKTSVALVCGIICICLIIGNGLFRQTLSAQAAYVELSGPAQIGFSLDEDNKVIDIVGLNEEGKTVVDSVDTGELSYYDALELILNSKVYQECIKNSNLDDVTVTVECEDSQSASQLETQTHHACEEAHNSIRNQQDGNKNEDTNTNTQGYNYQGHHYEEHH